jgi:hypothetical protein
MQNNNSTPKQPHNGAPVRSHQFRLLTLLAAMAGISLLTASLQGGVMGHFCLSASIALPIVCKAIAIAARPMSWANNLMIVALSLIVAWWIS